MKNFIAATIIFFFAGCALHNEYVKPDITPPQSSKNGIVFMDNNISNSGWWKRFNDKNLDILIDEILKNNNELISASYGVLQAKAQLEAANNAWFGSLGINGGGFSGGTLNTQITPNSQTGNLIKNAAQNQIKFSGYNAGFAPNLSANILQNLSNSEFANASLEQRQAIYNSVKISIISQGVGAYFMLSGLHKQLNLQNTLLANLIDMQKITASKVANDKDIQINILEYDKTINDVKNQILKTKTAISKTENALAVLLGKNPQKFLNFSNIDMLDANNKIDSDISSNTLKNRPDILTAEAKLKMANANLNLANSLFFPNISLTGNGGGASMALSNLFGATTGFWFLSAAASMPILNASSYQEIKAAKHGKYVAYYDYVQSVKAAFADVDDSLTNYQNSLAIYNNSQYSANAEQKINSTAFSKYINGAKDMGYYLDKNCTYIKALISENEAKMNSLDAVVAAYLALSFD